jgi:hypothetical protein
MHTAHQLRPELFAPSIDGQLVTYREVFPGWDRRDRFGLVVDRPVGGIGAALLTQLAVTAYFDVDPGRVGHAYPEIYVFHVGEFHGSHAQFDAFPPRKEVVVPDNGPSILEAVNDRGITRLAVVDGPVQPVCHHLREPGQAHDTIASAFAYSPTGRIHGPDLEIAGTSLVVEQNVDVIVDPEATTELQAQLIHRMRKHTPTPVDETFVAPRADGPPAEERQAAGRRRWDAVGRGGLPVETYRRITVDDALGMLHRRGSPALAVPGTENR